TYVHRIGRTGRAGNAGEAITLVTPRERGLLAMLERGIHRRLEWRRLPAEADLAGRRLAAFRDELLSVLATGELDSSAGVVEELSSSHEVARLAAAALKMAAEGRPARSAPSPRPSVRPAAEPGPDRRASEPGPLRRGHQPRGSRDEVKARLFL